MPEQEIQPSNTIIANPVLSSRRRAESVSKAAAMYAEAVNTGKPLVDPRPQAHPNDKAPAVILPVTDDKTGPLTGELARKATQEAANAALKANSAGQEAPKEPEPEEPPAEEPAPAEEPPPETPEAMAEAALGQKPEKQDLSTAKLLRLAKEQANLRREKEEWKREREAAKAERDALLSEAQEYRTLKAQAATDPRAAAKLAGIDLAEANKRMLMGDKLTPEQVQDRILKRLDEEKKAALEAQERWQNNQTQQLIQTARNQIAEYAQAHSTEFENALDLPRDSLIEETWKVLQGMHQLLREGQGDPELLSDDDKMYSLALQQVERRQKAKFEARLKKLNPSAATAEVERRTQAGTATPRTTSNRASAIPPPPSGIKETRAQKLAREASMIDMSALMGKR